LPRPPRSTPLPYTTLFRSPTLAAALALDADLPRYHAVLLPDPPTVEHTYAVTWALATLLVAAAVLLRPRFRLLPPVADAACSARSEEHTSELQSQSNLVCR